MAKAIYKANVELTQGSQIKGFPVEFITDEKNIDSIHDKDKLNQTALKYVKNQNKDQIEKTANGKYSKLIVRGVSKIGLVEKNNPSKKRTKKGKLSKFNKFLGVIDQFLGD